MGSRRAPLQHPLAQPFQRAAESLTTALGESSVAEYHGTVHLFLTYLGTHHPQVRSLEQLHRDPHILGWLSQLRSHMPPLAKFTLAARIVRLRRLLEELAWTQQLPALAHLLGRDDVPRRDHLLPRPLTPEQYQRIQQELQRRNDLTSNALLLLRHTGMRIGECVDLSLDCLRPLGPGQWVLHVPLGKLGTERWVPVDSVICQIVNRLRSLRPPQTPDLGRLLLPRQRGRYLLIRTIRATLQEAAATAGIKGRIVREYHLARTQPRHLVPTPRAVSSPSPPSADLASLIDSLRATQHVLEMFRRSVVETSPRRLLDRLANRLVKIVTAVKKLNTPEK